ncbi:hypothetical protein TNCV_4578171 [Trichonephila clavipes]|nr:hypothetical protein TNCV_4578171 [Trichonephila clavipes]
MKEYNHSSGSQLRFSLAASSGALVLRSTCIEGFMIVVFMRGDQPFKSYSIDFVCKEHGNMYTERLIIEGLFSFQMYPSMTLKVIPDLVSFGENLELGFVHDTAMKEVHTNQAVSVFGMLSLWANAHNSMFFQWRCQCSHLYI